MQTYFVTGTDTEVGKTYVTTQLMAAYIRLEERVAGLKPIAAGVENINGKRVNADAYALQQTANVPLPMATINPFCFDEPIAPHIAAARQNMALTRQQVKAALTKCLSQIDADYCFIEGAGGWLLPLNTKETLADVVADLQVPVILVVGMRLGCLNHAMLSMRAIRQHGCECVGWVANCLAPDMPMLRENIQTLKDTFDVPCLKIVDYLHQA